ARLDPAHYLQSLLHEGFRLQCLTETELEQIQLQSIRLLAQQTERYNSWESSSVKTETAQNILQSIFYTVGILLKNLPDPDAALAEIKTKPLNGLFRQGRKLIESQFIQAKDWYQAVQTNRVSIDNQAYNDTLDQGIALFFSNYDPDFGSHAIPTSIDYPLAADKLHLTGIEYLNGYLQQLFWENQFCQHFTAKEVGNLLRGYNPGYQDLLINIFEIILTNLAGMALAGKPLGLSIEPTDRQFLQNKLSDLPPDRLENLLREAAFRICTHYSVTEPFLQQYILTTLCGLKVRLKESLTQNKLEAFFISPQERHQPGLRFTDGPKMADEVFRHVTEEILSCRYVTDKIALIHREVNSLTDLVDLLECGCIFDREFTAVFRTLDDMKLALLLKKLPTNPAEPNWCFTENEPEWQQRLHHFLRQMNPAQFERIKNLSLKITLD
ncbi:MAG TPA: DUF6179 domain-containing protein, partial [Bacillota bacterium]|nr:DUF6179 domain-containing protein [Bacillota bacterium]